MSRSRRFCLALATAVAVSHAMLAQAAQERRPQARTIGDIADYLMPESAEVPLALSAAPPSVSASAVVYALRATGYVKVREGANGFTCVVQRAWSAPLMAGAAPDFFNPRLRAPICYNPSASRTIFPEYLRRTELAMAGKTPDEMRTTLLAEIGSGALADLAAVGGAHDLESGLPQPSDYLGSSFATFVMEAKHFVPVSR